jgi:hypothetical protein
LTHAFRIGKHFLRRKPEHPQAHTAHVVITLAVVVNGIRFKVSGPINFYNQMSFAAVKVGNVGAKRMLASKLETQLLAPQQCPQFLFRWRHFAAELSAGIEVTEGTG